MANTVTESQTYKNFTATTTIVPPTGFRGARLLGIFVASSSSGTIKVQDGASTVVNTFFVNAGTFYPIPAECSGTVTITVAGTLDATVFYTA